MAKRHHIKLDKENEELRTEIHNLRREAIDKVSRVKKPRGY